MPRKPRLIFPNQCYHLINRGNNQRNIFHSPFDFQYFYSLLEHYKNKFEISIYSFVLMINHFHLLAEAEHPKALIQFMKCVQQKYAEQSLHDLKASGHLWQGRYKSILIQEDAYFLQCVRYIELNPVRANIVSHPRDYTWSSYRAHVGHDKVPFLDNHPLLSSLSKGAGNTGYEQYVEDEVERARYGQSDRFSKRPYYASEEYLQQQGLIAHAIHQGVRPGSDPDLTPTRPGTDPSTMVAP